MPQSVLGPARKTGVLAYAIQLSARCVWHYLAHQAAVMAQPQREIRLYRDKSASSTLCLCSLHFDMSTREIDLAPLQSFYFSLAKSRKRANGQHWNNTWLRPLCRLQQRAQFIDHKYLRRSVDQLRLRSKRDRVKINHPTASRVTEQHSDVG